MHILRYQQAVIYNFKCQVFVITTHPYRNTSVTVFYSIEYQVIHYLVNRILIGYYTDIRIYAVCYNLKSLILFRKQHREPFFQGLNQMQCLYLRKDQRFIHVSGRFEVQ